MLLGHIACVRPTDITNSTVVIFLHEMKPHFRLSSFFLSAMNPNMFPAEERLSEKHAGSDKRNKLRSI